MAKYGNEYYLQLSRSIFNDDRYKGLSLNAKWLFVVLNELEQRFTGNGTDWFYRSNEDLAVDMGVSLRTLYRAKAELAQTDLIKLGFMRWVKDKGTPQEKKSEKRITTYTILK